MKPKFFAGVFLFLSLLLSALPAPGQGNDPNLVDPSILPEEWDEETVKLFEHLVVLDERLKPIATFAAVKLLKYRGIKGLRLKLVGGGKRDLKPAAWFLDCLFYPEVARQYPIFLVEDSDALERIGLAIEKKKRERYSYNEIEPARERLEEAAKRYAEIKAQNRTAVQAMIVDLANNIIDFEYLTRALDFGREGIPEYSGEVSSEQPESIAASAFVRTDLEQLVSAMRERGSVDNLPPHLEEMAGQYLALAQTARGSVEGTNWFPPRRIDQSEWASCGELFYETMQLVPDGSDSREAFEFQRDWAADRLESFEQLVSLRDDRSAFKDALQRFCDARAAEMEPRIEEGKKIAAARSEEDGESWQERQARQFTVSGAEVTYQHANFFQKAMFVVFLLFLLVAVSWISPGARWSRVLRAVTFWGMAVPLGLLVVGIGFRVYIMGRAPVTELYETIPYITLVACVVGLIMDRAFRLTFYAARGLRYRNVGNVYHAPV